VISNDKNSQITIIIVGMGIIKKIEGLVLALYSYIRRYL
jgi:hypothetical protein